MFTAFGLEENRNELILFDLLCENQEVSLFNPNPNPQNLPVKLNICHIK